MAAFWPICALLPIVALAAETPELLQLRCFPCHGAARQMGNIRLDQPALARQNARRVLEMTAAGKMPPGQPLSATELASIRTWAEGQKPWSFYPIQRPSFPAGQHPVDHFIQATLSTKGIRPSPQADRRTLARRLHLDLTGLLPSPADLDAFVQDPRPDAYSRLVDTLLSSPHFGENFARHWLDLARYADSEGGVQDFARPYAWRYRDWLIQAFNNDMPFDRFTAAQLAGDLLPTPDLAATGFQRQTITSREGGIELDRLRFEQLLDRTSTLGTAWLGLTVGCAQCHDHKYDPITQQDFYSLMAFFENAEERDVESPLPGELNRYRTYAGRYRSERKQLLKSYKILKPLQFWEDGARDARLHPGQRPNWDISYDVFLKLVDHGEKILLKKPSQRSTREQDAMVDFFVNSSVHGIGKEMFDSLKLKELGAKLKQLEEQYPRLSRLMTLADSGENQPTHIRLRGNWTDKGTAVLPQTPSSLPPWTASKSDRLALAQWLVSRENPLTPRVAMNRLWLQFFGRGLVRTAEDFGTQGELPSHPELLDWLASEFRDSGWSMKRMIRLVVLSNTYRQSSVSRPDLESIDPGNILLARQSRLRLPAELIRDAALRVAGLLHETVGGESIRPPQPPGVADLQYSMKWEETKGPDRYRRGLYIFQQRTAAYPLLMTFDAPGRSVSCARRETSNTPLQPLNLMNDPVFVEAARALSERIEALPEHERLSAAFALCFSREPSPSEREAVLRHLARRGWFGVSRALLNTDEFLTRE